MPALSHKAKHYGLIALKVLILAVTFWFIYSRITSDEGLSFQEFIAVLDFSSPSYYLWFLLLATVNWGFEILKWQSAVRVIRPISYGEAARQSLASLIVSLATPNRIGDYGAKAVYYPSGERKKVLLMNFLSNALQLSITIIFGLLGLAVVSVNYELDFSALNLAVVAAVLVFLVWLGFQFKKKELVLKGLSIERVFEYYRSLSKKVNIRLLLFSIFRYLCFSYLFLKLLRFFEADIAMSQAWPLIFSMYLLVSIVPTLFILDVVVRGGVAVWLFSLAGVPEWPVLCAVLGSWLLNFVFPALIGSFFLFTYRPNSS